MAKKLTETEKALIHLALDYEKYCDKLEDNLGDIVDFTGQVEYDRLYSAILLPLEKYGDVAVDVVLNYVDGRYRISEVFGIIERTISGDSE